MAHCILGRDLALAEGRVRELPIAGAVTDRIDVGLGRPTVLVGGDAFPLVKLDLDILEAEILDGGAAAGCHEHEVGLGRLTAAEVDG